MLVIPNLSEGRWWRWLAPLGVILAIASAAFAACGDGDTEVTPTATPTFEPGSYQLYPQGTGTGSAIVDQTARAVEDADVAAIIELFQFQEVPCLAESGIGGPPTCRTKEGEAEGTLVDVIQIVTCELEWHRPDEVEPYAGLLARPGMGVLALGTAAGGQSLLFVATPGASNWASITINSSGITAVDFPCGEGPEAALAAAGPLALPPRQ